MQVPAAYGKMRLWRNTPLANDGRGQHLHLPARHAGIRVELGGGQRFPAAGVAQLSRTTVDIEGPYVLQNYGDLYGSGTKTHALTLYRHSSGALVFGAGTVQWAWGVDDEHAFQTGTPTSDVRIKQATVNFLADMGVQPATLQSGLVAATASTATRAAPTVAITNAPAATVGAPYTFSGTVTDAGGQVAGVEVSSDGGTTWHPADVGRGRRRRGATPSRPGSRASSRCGHGPSTTRPTCPPPVSASAAAGPRQCPCSIWSDATVPGTPDTPDPTAVEVGVKWRASVQRLRARACGSTRAPATPDRTPDRCGATTGQRLATGTFENETATGWQTLVFPTSVAVTANTTYVASYFAPAGHYSSDVDYFTGKGTTLEPLTALQSGTDGPNGVYRIGTSGFPNQSFDDANYWVDVVWAETAGTDTRKPLSTATSPANGAGSIALASPLTVTFDEPIDPASVQFTVTGPAGPVAGTTALSVGRARGDLHPVPAAGGRDPVLGLGHRGRPRRQRRRGAGHLLLHDRITAPGRVPVHRLGRLHPAGDRERERSGGGRARDEGPLRPAGSGAGGALLQGGRQHRHAHRDRCGRRPAPGWRPGRSPARATSGWQTLTFATPVDVTAGTTYVVSYFAPNGRYAADSGYFNGKGADYQSCTRCASGVDGGNGVYRYGAGGGFPTSTFGGGNYWVDAIFQLPANADVTPPTLTGQTPAVGGDRRRARRPR